MINDLLEKYKKPIHPDVAAAIDNHTLSLTNATVLLTVDPEEQVKFLEYAKTYNAGILEAMLKGKVDSRLPEMLRNNPQMSMRLMELCIDPYTVDKKIMAAWLRGVITDEQLKELV